MATLVFLCLLLSSTVFASADDYSSEPAKDSQDLSPASPVPDKSSLVLDPNMKIKVVIEGVVLCQDCGTRGTWSLYNSRPIQGAKVGITCRDTKNRPTGYQAQVTDANGYFYAPFDVGYLSDFFRGQPTEACFVRLLSSPDMGCNDLTNINWGIVGSPAKFNGKLFKGDDFATVVLEAGPLSFRPKWCPISG